MSRSVFRKPSIKKSLSAKYKGAYKRKIKKALIPGYGTRAAGWLHPKRKLYNKIYYRTSIDTRKFLTGDAPKKRTTRRATSQLNANEKINSKELNRIDPSLFPDSGDFDRHPKLKIWVLRLIQYHRYCYYAWKIFIVLFILTAMAGWEWGYFACFYGWAIAVILRIILPMVINTINAIIKENN